MKEGAAWVCTTCHLAQTDVTYHGSAAVTCAYAHKGCEGLRAQGRDLMKVDMDKMAKIFAAKQAQKKAGKGGGQGKGAKPLPGGQQSAAK